jgi:chloride channel protein, CIC family
MPTESVKFARPKYPRTDRANGRFHRRGNLLVGVLVIELTGRDRSFILPLLLSVGTATVVARTIDRRSIYDARFTDKEVKGLQQARAPSAS